MMMINWSLFLVTIMGLSNNRIPQQLLKILDELYKHHQSDTLILINNDSQQFANVVMASIPKIILSQDVNHSFDNFPQMNTKFLIVFTLTDPDHHHHHSSSTQMFKILTKFVKQIPKTLNIKIIALVANQTYNKTDFLEYFTRLKDLQLYDAVIIPIHGFKIEVFYNYKAKPSLELIERNFKTITVATQTFINQIVNVKQTELLTYPDQLLPRTILYYDYKGELKMLGYIGRLITTYAEKINASLRFPFPVAINNPIFFTDILEMTLNGSLDIPASLACLNEVEAMKHFSRFIEVGQWFPMLPTAEYLTPLEIYYSLLLSDLFRIFIMLFIIFTILLFITHLLCHVKLRSKSTAIVWPQLINQQVILGLLGLPVQWPRFLMFYKSHKLLIILLQFTGIMFSIFSNTYLASSITSPPLHKEINSFNEINKRGMKILMLDKASHLLSLYWGDKLLLKYNSLIVRKKNITEYMHLRNSFNKSVAFAITSSLWSIYEKQQMYFAEKLFRRSPTVYFSRMMIYALPLPPNSIYDRSLNKFIANLQAAGILKYWYESSFYDMIATGHMSFKDISHAHNYFPAKLKDFQLIWLICAGGLLMASLGFIIELLVFQIKLNKNKS